MNRRVAIQKLLHQFTLGLITSVVAWFGFTAQPVQAAYFFFRYRFHYSVHRYRRRLRWRVRRAR